MADSRIKRALRRNTHRRWIEQVYNQNGLSGGASVKRKAVRQFLLWVMSELASGRCVELNCVGVLHGTFRKGRKGMCVTPWGDKVNNSQEDTYCLKIKASNLMKAALRRLAKTNPDPATVFRRKPQNNPEPSSVRKARKEQHERELRAVLEEEKAQSPLPGDEQRSGMEVQVGPGPVDVNGVEEAVEAKAADECR